jgi:protein ImuB
MKLLLSVHLPLLPLESLRPNWCEPGPYAVIDQGRVLAVSPEAAALGVRTGMRGGGVAAISPETATLERDAAREQQTLHALALALMQYTPEVTPQEDASLLLDVTASLRLFGGAHALCRRVARSTAALGLSAQLGAAPTAQGAWLLARASRQRGRPLRRRVLRLERLRSQLDQLPCALLSASLPYADWLNGIAAHRLGELRALPRPGLQRRTSARLLADLDRAYGEAPELFEWLQAPKTFSARIETFDRIEHAHALLYGATQLLAQLAGWLTVQQLAIRAFTLWMEHERGRAAIAPTPLDIMLAEPAWQDSHLIRLLKERLAKVELTAPVIALRLEALKLEPMRPPTESLFPEPGGTPEDFNRLLELLTARLGADNVLVPAAVQDYRPEVGNAWMPANARRPPPPGAIMADRPFWLLPQPLPLLMRDERPCYGSPLKLIRGPERMEVGWWGEKTVVRDYYVGQGADAACYWLYLERGVQARWFLHGLYA